MDIYEHLSNWCDRFSDVMLDNPGDPHCPACATVIELARLRAQVAVLLEWAKPAAEKVLFEWKKDSVSLEELVDAAQFLGRIKNGEFGEVA